MALKWIHKNIHHFGGDNKQITVAGHSAGTWCRCTHTRTKPEYTVFFMLNTRKVVLLLTITFCRRNQGNYLHVLLLWVVRRWIDGHWAKKTMKKISPTCSIWVLYLNFRSRAAKAIIYRSNICYSRVPWSAKIRWKSRKYAGINCIFATNSGEWADETHFKLEVYPKRRRAKENICWMESKNWKSAHPPASVKCKN